MLLNKHTGKIFLLLFAFFPTKGNEKQKMGALAQVVISSVASTVCGCAAFGCAKASKYFFEQSIPPYENLKSSLKKFKTLKQLKKLKNKIRTQKKDFKQDAYSLAKNGGATVACAAGMMTTAVLAIVLVMSIPLRTYPKSQGLIE